MVGERHQLEVLRWYWGSFYEIELDGIGGEWTARRHDNGRMLTATSADELVRGIRRDFAIRPVPRRSRRLPRGRS